MLDHDSDGDDVIVDASPPVLAHIVDASPPVVTIILMDDDVEMVVRPLPGQEFDDVEDDSSIASSYSTPTDDESWDSGGAAPSSGAAGFPGMPPLGPPSLRTFYGLLYLTNTFVLSVLETQANIKKKPVLNSC